jgi:hypothetical protein
MRGDLHEVCSYRFLPIGPLWGPFGIGGFGFTPIPNKRMRLFAGVDKFMGQPP